MKRVDSDGNMVLVCLYVDDVTYAVSHPALADQFLAQLRERFVFEEGEGKPIEYLLGIAIHQDLDKGTIHLNMETVISKLCMAILSKEELIKSNSVMAPMLQTPLLRQKERSVPKITFDYLSVVGSLLHISNCLRPDISYAVGNLARLLLRQVMRMLELSGEFFSICIERNHWELLIIERVINRETYPWSLSKQSIHLMMGLTRQKCLLIQIMQQMRLEGQLWDA